MALEIGRGESCVLGDAGRHARTQLLLVMDGAGVVGPPVRLRTLCEPDSRLSCQPTRRSAARTRRALAPPQLFTRLGRRRLGALPRPPPVPSGPRGPEGRAPGPCRWRRSGSCHRREPQAGQRFPQSSAVSFLRKRNPKCHADSAPSCGRLQSSQIGEARPAEGRDARSGAAPKQGTIPRGG